MNRVFMLLCLLSALPWGANAASNGRVLITGNIRDNTCYVEAASKNFTVDLGINSNKQFSRAGTASIPQEFTIALSPCGGAAAGVKIGFYGISDPVNSDLLKIQSGSGYASSMGVEILDKDHVQVPINTVLSTQNYNVITPSQRNVLTFYSRLVSTQYPVGSGTVDAVATFSMEFL